jgi:ATP-dependent RNA helicase DDX19/DBP5
MLCSTRRCPTPLEKVKVLKDMIFPNCEKLGQTIIFVATKDTSRQLHMQLKTMGFKITSIQVRGVCGGGG